MKNLRFACTSFVIGLVAVALSGCGSSVMSTSHTQSSPPPTVAGAGLQVNGSAANRWLYVQFSEDMDPATINSKTITLSDSSGAAVRGNVAYFANFKAAGFQPSPALQENSTYTMTVTTGVASDLGVHLAKAYTNQFTTRATTDESPIYVKSVSPSPNATCVSFTAPITITFSEGADITTLTSANIIITGPHGGSLPYQIGYNVGTATVTLTPDAYLPPGKTSVNVSNVADAAGVRMTRPYAWSFTVGTCNNGGGTTTQYMAPLSADVDNTMNGQVTVDTAGNTAIQFSDADGGATYTVQFCPAEDPSYTNGPPCFDVTTLSADSSGNASKTVKFPKSGDWAGDFYVIDSADKTAYQTYLYSGVSGETYMSILLSATKTNEGTVTTFSPQQPLTSGSVSYSNGSLKVTVKGAMPNNSYFVNESETTVINSSGTYLLDTFTTDASGNGSVTTTLDDPGGDLFQVGDNNNPTGSAGYIGGFSVPQ